MTFENDYEALRLLNSYGIYEVKNGVLRIYVSAGDVWTTLYWHHPKEVREAVDYLIAEFDFVVEDVY